MRLRRLLFVLAFVSAGAPPLYAALGDAARCSALQSTKSSAETANESPTANARSTNPQLSPAVVESDAVERDYLIRTIVFEAFGEPEEGKTAVAHVILNRKSSGRWGDRIKDVVTYPWQFEPWMTRRREMENLSPQDSRYQNAAKIADAILAGERPDPTAGATHFLNPTVVRHRRGGSLPSWARGDGQPIGRHTFYSPDESRRTRHRDAILQTISTYTSGSSGEARQQNPSAVLACERHALTARLPAVPLDRVQLGG